jgi:hypothetical protein
MFNRGPPFPPAAEIIFTPPPSERAPSDRTLYLNETWELAERRWTKELREFRKPSKASDDGFDFDISKIPDIYDNIKYDMEVL